MIKFRQLKDSDNIYQIADFIYQTDRTFDKLFKNRKNSIKAIGMMIKSDIVNPYHRKFLTVAYDEDHDGDILGIVLAYRGEDFTYSDVKSALSETGCSNFIKINLFPLYDYLFASHVGDNDYYIGNLFVNPNFRHNRLGSKLVKFCIDKAKDLNCDSVMLDVEYFKKELPNFYMKLGFKYDSKHWIDFLGYSNGCYGMKLSLK